MQIAFFVVTLVAMYLLLVRPQQQRVKQHQAFVNNLSVGDDVVTAGGLVGTVIRLREDELEIRTPGGVELTLVRSAISHSVMEKVDND